MGWNLFDRAKTLNEDNETDVSEHPTIDPLRQTKTVLSDLLDVDPLAGRCIGP